MSTIFFVGKKDRKNKRLKHDLDSVTSQHQTRFKLAHVGKRCSLELLCVEDFDSFPAHTTKLVIVNSKITFKILNPSHGTGKLCHFPTRILAPFLKALRQDLKQKVHAKYHSCGL